MFAGRLRPAAPHRHRGPPTAVHADWISTLRIERVLTAADDVLFDVLEGHPGRAVDDAIDTADVEYSDILIDVIGGDSIIRYRRLIAAARGYATAAAKDW